MVGPLNPWGPIAVMQDLFLYLFGAIGALIYSFPKYLAELNLVPPGKFALAVLLFSVFVGGVFAPILVPMLGHRWSFLVQPNPYPLAVGIGLVCNPLVPIFVRKMTGWADAYTIGGKS